MKLLIDMNLAVRWAEYLREAGFNADHWSTLGRISAPDREICDYARAHGYILLTNDLDFPRILACAQEAKPSVVLLRGERLIPELRGAAVVQCLHDHENDLRDGAIVSLDWSGQPRARILPLK